MTVSEAETPTKGGGCTLPYPDRFHAAVQYITKLPAGAKPIKDETRLLLYALGQQATEGPCRETKPWGWNVVETAKWQTWSQLGSMSKVEAMRLYVRELEDEQSDWFSLLGDYTPPPPDSHAAEKPVGSQDSNKSSSGLGAVPDRDAWVKLDVIGAKKPPPRYEHAAAVIDGTMYVVGGNCGGRYLGDVWALDLETLEWVSKSAPSGSEAYPPSAGHDLVSWGGKLLSVGGITKKQDKSASLAIRLLDTNTMAWSLLEPTGPAPPQLGGHTATLIGSSLYIFGGEDNSRRLNNDLHILDLEAMEWSAPETTGTKPLPRSDHVATAFAGRYLLVFGGGSVAHCYQDLSFLDTEQMEWFSPSTKGKAPSPRAGHAAAAVGDKWFVVGGGNNTSGCMDMLSLDLSELGTGTLKWEPVAMICEKGSPIASEGLSLQSAPGHGALVAFGGYTGKYHNEINVFKPLTASAAPAAIAPPKAGAAEPTPKAAEPTAEPESAPLLEKEASEPFMNGNGNGVASKPMSTSESEARLEAAEKEAKDLAREAAEARESAAHEMALMRRQLDSAQAALGDAEKALEETRGSLSAEQNKNFKLEVEVAELRQSLAKMSEMETELEGFRRQAQEAQAKKGTGLWGYIAG